MNKNNILASLFILLFSSSLLAAERFETRERELFRKNHKINLDLNPLSVRCSDVGYGNVQLKINVDALEYISFFDHSNPGESAPCMTAGMMSCRQSFQFPLPGEDDTQDDLLQKEDDILTKFRAIGKVQADLEQVMKESLRIDHQDQTCHRYIHEEVTTVVDGTTFTHYRSGNLGEYPYDICVQL
jgi:hypothetical protein